MKRFIAAMLVLAASLAPALAQPPVITNQPVSRAVWVGCNVSFTAGVSGSGPFTCQWQLNGTNIPNNIITTVAGNGANSDSRDGGPATNASFFDPTGVAVDKSGNIFIADQGQTFAPNEGGNRIREVSTNGIIMAVAGTGTNIVSGDGGPAVDAGVANPLNVMVDGSGNLFTVEELWCRVRKMNANGVITTYAGTGELGYSDDGGPATNADLWFPFGEELDAAGNLFIADTGNNCIRKVDTNGIITTVAGNGIYEYSGDGGVATNAGLKGPTGVALDASGNLFIADNDAYRIRRVDTNGIISTVAGTGTEGYSGDGGPATNATMSGPFDVAIDVMGNLLILDNNTVRKVDANGIITTIAGTTNQGFSGDGGPATNASLHDPTQLAVDGYGDIFIADALNFRIRKITNTQGPTLALSNATPGNAGAYQLVVTGPGGSVASSAASLIVATSPLVYGTTLNADRSVTLSCLSPPGSTNVLLSATSLLPGAAWLPLSTNVASGDGSWQFTDSNAGGPPVRFYRFLKH